MAELVSGVSKERVNWKVAIMCVDCDAVFAANADPSKDVIVNSSGVRVRLLMLAVPNECPKCHSIRVVEKSTEAG